MVIGYAGSLSVGKGGMVSRPGQLLLLPEFPNRKISDSSPQVPGCIQRIREYGRRSRHEAGNQNPDVKVCLKRIEFQIKCLYNTLAEA